jgi:hypothetical protein
MNPGVMSPQNMPPMPPGKMNRQNMPPGTMDLFNRNPYGGLREEMMNLPKLNREGPAEGVMKMPLMNTEGMSDQERTAVMRGLQAVGSYCSGGKA